MRPLAALSLAAALLLAGCGGGVVIGDVDGIGYDCDREMAALTGSLGFPEEVDRRFEGGLYIETFFYWRTGLGITFTWSGDLPCQRRDFPVTR
jgi:hypothetical protein